MRGRKLQQSGWLTCVMFAIGLTISAPARADSLDFVLDVLYKAGVIDGNVKAAKPLISCLAKGKSVKDCTLGAAGQTELASDPQVQNVLDIYQSFQQKDWFGVVKKSGVTVGCALIPGGQIKDALCGEIGKIAMAAVDGVGSVLHSMGEDIVSLFGGGDDKEPLPMWDEDYYRLYFAPAYHKLIMALDAQDGSFEPTVQNIYQGCTAYYGQFQQYATNGCEADAPRLRDEAKLLRKTLLQEGDSWFQLHSEPRLESWAQQHFGEDSAGFVAEQVGQCRASVKAAIPLPNPGFDRCDAFKSQLQNTGLVPPAAIGQIDAQCRAQAKALEVSPPHDAYAMACENVQKKLPVRLIGAMGVWKQRMNLAQAAGCANNGTPDSIHCDTYASQVACVKAIPDKSSICGFDMGKANQNFAQEVFAQLYEDSAKAGKAQRCLRTGMQVLCFRPVKQQGCKIYVVLHGDKYGLAEQGDAICLLKSDAEYDQLKAKAQQVVAALDGKQISVGGTNARREVRSVQQPRSTLRLAQVMNPDSAAVGACSLADNDPLRIKCAPGFQWDAQPARVVAVKAILGAPLELCGADYEADGADRPCLDGVAVGAFPNGPGNPPPPPPPVHVRQQLPPAVDKQHPPKKISPQRMLPIKPAGNGASG